MTNEFLILFATAASVALIHTLAGPDHYLPFIVISKARNWKMKKTMWFTALCGVGHVGSGAILGLIGIAIGITVGKLQLFEGIRGGIASWLFTSFGLLYMVWGLRRAYKNKTHKHVHFHDGGVMHEHEHTHHHEHAHIHTGSVPIAPNSNQNKKVNLTPWILFTIFVFGPCEPLIPIVMYPAAKHNYSEMIIVTLVFSIITISTMIALVTAASFGFKLLPMKKLERYSHALAGGTIFVCGLGMLFLGL